MVIQSNFTPPWWARNPHLQTIFPRVFPIQKDLLVENERLKTDDGDFIELAWYRKAKVPKGIVVIFHGLEGSIESHYAQSLIARLDKLGWWSVLMHFRGCGPTPNNLPRSYHSGDTGDARMLISELATRYPKLNKVAIGFSLGGNMLLKLLGETPEQNVISSAVAVSPPFDLAMCSESIGKGFSKIYQNYLVTSMKKRFHEKAKSHNYSELIGLDSEDISQLANFFDFDDKITGPLHGFEGAHDYYAKCSSIGFLRDIETPTLILHAKDDPFMHPDIVPKCEQLSSKVRLELSEKGGHVGFIYGKPWSHKVWLHDRIEQHLAGI